MQATAGHRHTHVVETGEVLLLPMLRSCYCHHPKLLLILLKGTPLGLWKPVKLHHKRMWWGSKLLQGIMRWKEFLYQFQMVVKASCGPRNNGLRAPTVSSLDLISGPSLSIERARQADPSLSIEMRGRQGWAGSDLLLIQVRT